MVEKSNEREFEWREVTDTRESGERTGPSRRTFLKSTGAVASATALFDAADTARGAVPKKPDTVDSLTASATVLAQQSPSLCGSGKITFADQTSNGSTVVVESVTLSSGGFVDIHDERLSDAPIDTLESVIGVSGYLAPGLHRNVTIALFDVPGKTFDRTALDVTQTLTAMAHHDTDANEEYDFARLNGAVDRPYLNDDASTVADTATVTVAAGPQRNTLRIHGTGTLADYAFAVTDSLREGRGLSSEDEITGPLAVGAVRAGTDTYEFTGSVTGFSVEGNVRVSINGVRVNPAQFSPTTLSIVGTGTYASYAFRVSGDLTGTDRLTVEDEITGSRAEGAVRAGEDRYRFTGEITNFDLDGEVRVLVNGHEIDVATTPQNTLTVRGSGSHADYGFTVTGDLMGDGLSSEDEITGASATGAVRAGEDRYRFTGSVTGLNLDGGATVLVNGTRVSPAQFPSTTLSIVGTGTYAAYAFAVSGDLTGDGLSGEDDIRGSSATGAVRAGEDRYRFTGAITRFDRTGEVRVLLNGEEIDPARF